MDFEKAIKAAKLTFDESLQIYSGLEREKHEPTTRIMHLIKSNIDVWNLELKHQQKIKEKD